MKRVTFSADGDLEITINPATNDGDASIYVEVEGIDTDSGKEAFAAKLHGWLPLEDAREFARYLNEMADKAEREAAQ